ncbi:MAG: UDP-N-acetylmuramate dehydrogenase [Cellulosilyticaceae bacterium]
MERQHIKALLAEKIAPHNIKENEVMAQHTTFKIGGPATFFVSPASVEELGAAIHICKTNNIPYYVMGNGSNLLVPDEGLEGVVIEVYKNLAAIEVKGDCITAEAGALLSRIAKEALENGLAGFEFAHGIPGTLGGAVAMNAGAYGGEMKDVLVDATIIDHEGQVVTLSKDALNLRYRHSLITDEGYTVVRATIKLQAGDKETIGNYMKDLMGRRKEKQPLEYPSAGSTFKRPEGYFAGKLIMDSGLRGHQIGGARVSDKHCGFVINTGNATCKDVLMLINYVQEEVKRQYGVTLEPEVKILG